jgi:AcrR family transcriptional regulator
VILDAAERHFAERGFSGASVREIAADAGLKNQASLYHHFRNKRALYEAVLARGLGPILALVAASGERAAAGTSASMGQLTQPEGFLDRVVDHLAQQPRLPQLIQHAALDDKKYLRSILGRTLRPLYAQGIGVLASAGRRWDDELLPHLGAGLYHLIFGYFANAHLLATVTQIDPLSPEAVEQQRRFLRRAVAELIGIPAGRFGVPRKRRAAAPKRDSPRKSKH